MLKEKLIRSKFGQKIKAQKNISEHREDIEKLKEELSSLINEMEQINVPIIFFGVPKAERIKNLSNAQWDRIKNWTFDFNNIDIESADKLKNIYPADKDVDYILKVYDGVKVFSDGYVRRLADNTSEYVNIVDGERVTAFQPENFEKTIYIFGSCTARGTGVEDKETIESFLQKTINKEYKKIRVSNKGIGCGYFLNDDILRIKELDLHCGDVIVILEPYELWEEYTIKMCTKLFFDLSDAFNNFQNKEWFTDYTGHTTSIGNQQIAQCMLQYLKDEGSLNNVVDLKKHRDGLVSDVIIKNELKNYLDNLKKYKNDNINNGAIVMNCNPFTNGHRYLIEQSAKQVDTLYIFVVEEDKSYFKFADRLELVQCGTTDIENVVVLKSGKFIISALTFPGYFMKENDPTIKVDTTNDLRIFGRYIAPELSIKKRFAGEEPIDLVTRQYNDNMRKILPKYGVEFIEIPRKENDGRVISASLVRKLIEDKDYEKISKLVPESTLKYLIENYGGNNV